jgi:hypothetical protein
MSRLGVAGAGIVFSTLAFGTGHLVCGLANEAVVSRQKPCYEELENFQSRCLSDAKEDYGTVINIALTTEGLGIVGLMGFMVLGVSVVERP